ncbi:DUF2742 domain-containing protein [Kutzneria buriramensis]|uniref:Uncharacterized protein DUF2742 n=1 Tax=Kutzneria buriramensis TaxID=1045776 RepID=A0A3E0I9X9_9PSEU|nr:DUF2742 domain-containing protein [Kutzneria buriramensis]REH55439.1 uncharacterized protein DUF2742 [Kutzneria buriramensis]
MHYTRAAIERTPQAVRRWAAPLLAAATQAGPIPLAGSPDWSRLADDDPRKWAAVVTSALAWLSEATSAATARRLRAELDAIDRAVAERFKAAACELSAAHEWSATGPAHAELERRRAAPPRRPIPPFDPVAAARWVRTGYSDPPCEGHAAA